MRVKLSDRLISRSLSALFMLLMLQVVATADVPHMIQYQGRLTDDAGNPLDTVVEMTFAIMNDSVGGSQLWKEVHSDVVVTDGLFNVLLGSISPLDFPDFTGATLWLGIAIGEGDLMVPRTPMVSSAYAIRSENAGRAVTAGHADTADIALGGVSNGWVDAGNEVYLSTITDSVGIGVTNPSAPLDVEGPGHAIIGISHGSGTAAGVYGGNDGTGFGLMGVSNDGRGVTGLSVNGFGGHFYGPKNYFSSNLGIGTETPEEMLHIYKNSSGATSFMKIQSAHASNWGEAGLRIQTPQNTWHFRMDDASNGQIPSGALGLRSQSGGEVMTWTEEGKIGVGTTAPYYRLEVSDEADGIWGKSSGDGIGVCGSSNTGFGGFFTGPKHYFSGFTGFGTQAPTHRVTVNGELALQKNGVTKYHLNYYNSGFNICETTVADYRLYIKDGGNVGIGTSNPTAKLHVNGDFKVNDSLFAGALQRDLVKADNIDDEPGVSGHVGWGSTLLTSSWHTLETAVVHAPGPGYVLALGSVHIWADHDLTGNSSAQFGITKTEDSLNETISYGFLLPPGADAGSYYTTSGFFEIYEIPYDGYFYYYLQARSLGDNDVRIVRRALALIYFPTTYGYVSSDQWKKSEMGGGAGEFPEVLNVGMPDAGGKSADDKYVRIPEEKLNSILSEMEDLKARLSLLEQK